MKKTALGILSKLLISTKGTTGENMYYFWIGLLGAIALLWSVFGLRMLRGMAGVPRLAGVETLAAWLLVASSALSDVEPLLNLWQGVKDPVAERSLTFYLGGVSAVLVTAGVAILTVGVIRGL